jgi:uncharacterized protein
MARFRILWSLVWLGSVAIILVQGMTSSHAQVAPDDAAIKAALRSGAFKQAAELLEQAAKSGHAESQYQLASLYRSGRGVLNDTAVAFKWMQAAAVRGHAKAQFNLGKMYLAGHGATSDRAQAVVWLQRSAGQGNDSATTLLAELAKLPVALTPPTGAGEKPAVKLPTNVPPLVAAPGDRPAVIEAARRGQVKLLQALIDNGANLKETDSEGNTALAHAAASGGIAVVDVLLTKPVDINARNKASETPVMLAAAKGQTEVVARLLSRGADVRPQPDSAATALRSAIRGCHEPVVRLLIANGADARRQTSDRQRRTRRCHRRGRQNTTLPRGIQRQHRRRRYLAGKQG